MVQLLKNPIVACTLCLNLFLGLLCLYLFPFGCSFSLALLFMYLCYAPVAFFSILWGFSRIRAQSGSIGVIGITLFTTAIILFFGALSFVGSGLAIESLSARGAWLPWHEFVMTSLGAAVFGFLFGGFFSLPFIFINAIAFFRYRERLRVFQVTA